MANDTTNIGVDLPPGCVRCSPGDFILQRSADDRWSVYLVEDIVQLRRLLPLKQKGVVVGLLQEEPLLDSVAPSYFGTIHLLVTRFETRHDSNEAAFRVITSRALGPAVEHLCLDIRQFPQTSNRVHSPETT